MDPIIATAFRRDLGLAQKDVHAGVVPSRASASVGHYDTWCRFCSELQVDPSLQELHDPIPIIQVFMRRYRTGAIAPSHRQVRSRTVEDAVRSVGQTFAAVGTNDPRLNSFGKIDFRLQRQLACYSKQDPPPNRVKPIPVPILQHVMAAAITAARPFSIAVADMIAIAFFFLLRPGEYTGKKSDTQPFRLADVQLFHGQVRLDLATASDTALLAATFATLTFTTQKNGVRGEVIGLAPSGSPQLSPTLAIARRVIHLRQHGAPPTTPLASYWNSAKQKFLPISPADITSALRLSCMLLGPTYGFLASDISARSLRASGAMALLCAHVDSDTIRLLGRWRSDEMLRYLHIQAEPIMRDFSSRMLQHGTFRLNPNENVPMF